MADAAADAALAELAVRPRRGELEGLAAGRIADRAARRSTVARRRRRGHGRVGDELRRRRAARPGGDRRACRTLLDEAARGLRLAAVRAAPRALDRGRRDLEVFLLQHRLDPLLARAARPRSTRSTPRC